jgi:hypothetical protein
MAIDQEHGVNDDPFRRKPFLDSGVDTLKVLLVIILFLFLISGLVYRW